MKRMCLLVLLCATGCKHVVPVKPVEFSDIPVILGHSDSSTVAKDNTVYVVDKPERDLKCYTDHSDVLGLVITCHISRAQAPVITTGKQFCDAFMQAADDFNEEHPQDTVGYGCGSLSSAANDAVILSPKAEPKNRF